MVNIKENILLAPFTTFGLGGTANYFAEAGTTEDIKETILFARERSVPFFILGGGSNILVSDSGFQGLVIKMSSRGITHKENGNDVFVTVAAGENWDNFVSYAVAHNWYGVENLSGIPGTVGAAPIQNIGAYGAEVKDVVESVAAYDAESGKEKIFSAGECRFAYRDSFFKSIEGRKMAIISVTFRLRKMAPLNFSYHDVSEYFQKENILPKSVTPEDMRSVVLAIRARKFPPLETLGTAGSFFKNPVVEEAKSRQLSDNFPDMPVYVSPLPGTVKISAAFLIDKVCGLKGQSFGKARSYEKNALVLVAERDASSEEVRSLAEKITKKVFSVTGIKLLPEVKLVGDFRD